MVEGAAMVAESQRKKSIRIGYFLPAWVAILAVSCAAATAQQSAPVPAVQTETANAAPAKSQASQSQTDQPNRNRRHDCSANKQEDRKKQQGAAADVPQHSCCLLDVNLGKRIGGQQQKDEDDKT